MNLNTDFFTLFELPATFHFDLGRLEARYLELQSKAHPDRFAAASKEKQRLASQWAACINEAYQTLKHPLSRARYLLSLKGHEADIRNNTVMEPGFLSVQMEWREAKEKARRESNHYAMERLYHQVRQNTQDHYQALSSLMDDPADVHAAIAHVHQLMFFEKLLSDIEEALTALEENGLDP